MCPKFTVRLNGHDLEFMNALTIAIPTYNRARQLSARLKELIPQLSPEVKVVIFDNGSTDSTKMEVQPFLGPHVEWRTVGCNRGISRNFMRVFEEMDSDWMWMLSDDDPVRPDALATLLQVINSTSAGTIAFKAQGNSVAQDGVYRTVAEFLEAHHVMNLSYISGMVFRRSAVEAGLSVLAPSAYTLLPHSMLALAALGKGHAIQTVAQEILIPQKGEHRVSRREFLLGLAAFPEFFSDPAVRKRIARQLRASSRWMIFSALAQVGSAEDIERWKAMIRVTEAAFAANGAGWWGNLLGSPWHSCGDVRREWILPCVRVMPQSLLRLFAVKLAKRTLQNAELTHHDASI
jgi:glycosyltransferase involved in cell wall biosynthesis